MTKRALPCGICGGRTPAAGLQNVRDLRLLVACDLMQTMETPAQIRARATLEELLTLASGQPASACTTCHTMLQATIHKLVATAEYLRERHEALAEAEVAQDRAVGTLVAILQANRLTRRTPVR